VVVEGAIIISTSVSAIHCGIYIGTAVLVWYSIDLTSRSGIGGVTIRAKGGTVVDATCVCAIICGVNHGTTGRNTSLIYDDLTAVTIQTIKILTLESSIDCHAGGTLGLT